MKMTAGELANLTHGILEGNPATILTHPSKIEEGKEGSVCFLSNAKYEHYLYSSEASLIIIPKDFTPKQEIKAALLRVENVSLTVSRLLNSFEEKAQKKDSEVHPTAIVSNKAQIGENVSIGAGCVIEEGAKISDGCVLSAQVYIAKNVTLGKDCYLYPGVKIYKDCELGNQVIIHSNTVIGSDGFGFAPNENGGFTKIPQLGNVVIKDDVEIGSNTSIDRGTMGSTLIGKGCKLDNLIQIAHNVQIGENTVIAAQSGVAGSAKIGKNCMIGGQVGIAGHLTIADGTMLQAQSGVASSLKEENGKWYGSPALDYYTYLRAYSEFRKLPDFKKRIEAIEKQLEDKLSKNN